MKRLILIALALFISACAAPKKEKDAEAYYNRGVAWQKKGDYDRAINDYTKAIKLNPKFVKAYVNRGSCYASKGQFDQAISDSNKAIELNPNLAEAYNNRGLAYLKLDQADSGCHDLQKACDLGNCIGLGWANERGLCR